MSAPIRRPRPSRTVWGFIGLVGAIALVLLTLFTGTLYLFAVGILFVTAFLALGIFELSLGRSIMAGLRRVGLLKSRS